MNIGKYNVVIACGGKGSRLREISNNTPKPLYPIAGKSTLERCLEQLIKNDLNDILITTSFKSNIFKTYIEKFKKKLNLRIDTYFEKIPMGECGSLWEVKDNLSENFIFINGDLIFSIDFKRFINFHERLKSKITLVTHTSDHPTDSDLISSPNGYLIEDIFSKNKINQFNKNAYLGNAGIFLINREVLNIIDRPDNLKCYSVFHYLIDKIFEKKINIFSYNTSEYIKDMGTPKRLKTVEKDIKNKLVNKKNYKKKQKALFIDRDNTVIYCPIGKYVIDKQKIQFLKKNIDNIAHLSKNFDLVCMVTNQPIISMGVIDLNSLDDINSFVVKYCLERKLKIDVVTFCPHHPHKGFEGEVPYLKTVCFCRKPNPGLFLEQAFLRNIDLESSLMIGDSEIDFIAAKNAGCNYRHVNQL